MVTISINERSLVSKVWFLLLAVYTVTSYFAQDLLLSSKINSYVLYAFLAYSIFAILLSGRFKITPIVIWGIVCLSFALVAMLYSPEFSIFGGTYYSLIVNFVLVFILTQMKWTRERFDFIMITYVLSAAGLIIALAVTGNLNDESGRLGEELMGNANILALMLMVAAIYAFWLIIASKSKLAKILSLISMVVIYYGMFLSGGRKFVIIPIVFAYFLLLCKPGRKGMVGFLKNTVIAVLILAVLYYVIMKVPMFYDTIGYRFDGFFALFGDEAGADGSTLIRKKMIEIGWEAWPESPIWGHGFDSFKYYNETITGHKFYSHNNYIELLYNQGILGFLAYYGFYVYLLYRVFIVKKQSLYKGFVLGVIVSCLFFEYFGVTYSVTPIQLLLLFSYLCINNFENMTEKNNVNS